jgi:hypothetical protein
MPNTLEALRVLQWGKEATKGTGVPATSKIAVPARNLTFDESGSPIYRPQLAKGVLIRNRGNETPVMHGTSWQLADSPWLYEQGANWLSMSVGSSGNSASGLSPYTYAYTRSLTADPAPTAWTIEERLSDGSNNRDVEYNYALAESLGFKYAEGGPLMFNAKGFARRVQSSTLTAAQTMPSPEIAPSALLTAFIDSAFGSIGGTQLTAQVIGMEFEFGTGFKPQMTADGRTDLDFTTPHPRPGRRNDVPQADMPAHDREALHRAHGGRSRHHAGGAPGDRRHGLAVAHPRHAAEAHEAGDPPDRPAERSGYRSDGDGRLERWQQSQLHRDANQHDRLDRLVEFKIVRHACCVRPVVAEIFMGSASEVPGCGQRCKIASRDGNAVDSRVDGSGA